MEVVPGPLVQLLEAADFRILMLDSLVAARDGKRIDHGELSRDQLAWLDEQLALRRQARRSSRCTTRPPTSVSA